MRISKKYKQLPTARGIYRRKGETGISKDCSEQ